jgi:hypothetical protein
LAHAIPARLTAAEGRKFAFTVGGAFLAFAALFFWRDKAIPMYVAGGLGSSLVLAGLVAPAHLGPVNRAWMGLALLLSKVTTPIFMGLVYFLVFTPMGALRRAMGKNAIATNPAAPSYWAVRGDASAPRRSNLERQF